MTVAQSWPLQQAVFSIVSAAAPTLQVFDYAPTTPPEEFVRLDGFNTDDRSYKNAESSRHAFEVHHFIRPGASASMTRGQGRGKQIIAAIHAALMAGPLLGQAVEHEYMATDSDMDGATSHSWSRYSVIL